MDFAYDARTEELRASMLAFMDSYIYPNEQLFNEQLEKLDNRWAWDSAPIIKEIRAEARKRGLWNLFQPGEGGGGLTNVQYATIAEISGRSMRLSAVVRSTKCSTSAPAMWRRTTAISTQRSVLCRSAEASTPKNQAAAPVSGMANNKA